ncbi:Lrp/AsnC family transcriptional regulator [Streptomyces sp. NPDC059373]
MQGSARLLSEDDLALIHALQLQPRGSWTDLGRALDVDPVTVARRWSRLAERGEAWIGLSPGPRIWEQVCAAFVEIDSVPGRTDGVARALCAHAHMLTIERSAGDHSLLATVAASDLRALSRYTLDVRLPETRNCAAISGPHNLILQASLHSVADIVRFEAHLAAAHPTLDVVQREITLRHDKLLGHILDPYGRSLGVVAPDVWREPAGPPG